MWLINHAGFAKNYKQMSENLNSTTKQIPVTIITGFLGSGKTTLLNRILQEKHGKKIAVVLNEIGEVNLDSEFVHESLGQELKIMNNGCVCCTVRGDLTKIAQNLQTSAIQFEHLIIETTGIADPTPVAQTFLLEENLRLHYYLDAIITVVDVGNIEKNLEICHETAAQIGFADIIILNKCDLISQENLQNVITKTKLINSQALVKQTINCAVPITELLNIDAFNLDKHKEINSELLTHYEHHHHDHAIESIYLEEKQPLDMEKLNQFMTLIILELGTNILRSKGVVNIKDEQNRIAFQGVHQNIGAMPDRPWHENEERKTQMVFIGKHIPADVLKEGLTLCIAK